MGVTASSRRRTATSMPAAPTTDAESPSATIVAPIAFIGCTGKRHAKDEGARGVARGDAEEDAHEAHVRGRGHSHGRAGS